MEYYTKSEGLGFLIRKSRIDFRIEFRGVSILFEFNSLIWLVSHDHHQTVRYGEVAGVSIAESTFSNSNGHKWPHDGATENLALRPGDVSTVKLCSKDEFVKWAKGGSDLPQVAEEIDCTDPVFYRQENSAFNSQSTYSQPTYSQSTYSQSAYSQSAYSQSNGPAWPTQKLFWSIIGPNFKMVQYGLDGLNNDSTNVRNEHFFKTFTISILVLDFSLVGPRPLYSILGNEESRIFGSC